MTTSTIQISKEIVVCGVESINNLWTTHGGLMKQVAGYDY